MLPAAPTIVSRHGGACFSLRIVGQLMPRHAPLVSDLRRGHALACPNHKNTGWQAKAMPHLFRPLDGGGWAIVGKFSRLNPPARFCPMPLGALSLRYCFWHPVVGQFGRLAEVQALLAAGVPSPACHLLSDHYNLTRKEYLSQLDRSVTWRPARRTRWPL